MPHTFFGRQPPEIHLLAPEDLIDEVEVEADEEDEDDEDDEEDEDDDDDDEDEQEEEEDTDYIPLITEAEVRVTPNTRLNSSRGIVFEDEELQAHDPLPQNTGNSIELIQVDSLSSREQGECSTSSSSKRIESQGTASGNGNETEAASCSICMEPWSSEGVHQVCCLPCGHVYGFSCIEKWIRCRRNSAKCPQCSRKCAVKDIIKLYVSRIAGIDGELQKNVLSLRAENDFLKMKIASLEEQICQTEEEKLWKRASCLENISSEEIERRTSEFVTSALDSQTQRPSGNTSVYGGQISSCCRFELEDEFVVEGARVFDLDCSNRILLLARRLPGMGGDHVLTKISLMYPYDSETIRLPPSTKAVKDLHISPCTGKHALFASLGKKLSILSMESNNIVLTYDLPGPAWSCSWDLNSPHYLYAGLQSGMLLVFDMRQTARALESINGLASYPVHTIHSVMQKPSIPCDTRTILSASSIGPSFWNTGGVGDRPFLVPELENQGVCISIAYCPSTDDIVSSFRPKVKMANDVNYTQTQTLLSTPSTVLGRGTLGSHVLARKVAGSCYKKVASSSANVNDVRMLKSAIVNITNCNPLFAYGDEVTHGLTLHGLPSLRVMHTLKPHDNPILDVKFAASLSYGILGCTSEDKLQLFSVKPS